MTDILERLQSLQTSLGTLWPEPNLHEEAAEKIIQLRKELDETKRAADAFVENEHLREENERLIRENKVAFEAVGGVVKANDKLKEENARLREALAPFVDAGHFKVVTEVGVIEEYNQVSIHVKESDLRAAAIAMGKEHTSD